MPLHHISPSMEYRSPVEARWPTVANWAAAVIFVSTMGIGHSDRGHCRSNSRGQKLREVVLFFFFQRHGIRRTWLTLYLFHMSNVSREYFTTRVANLYIVMSDASNLENFLNILRDMFWPDVVLLTDRLPCRQLWTWPETVEGAYDRIDPSF